MKVRLTIPALVLAALPGIPAFMFVIPPLLNASNTVKNLTAFGMSGAIVLVWLLLVVKVASRIRTRLAVNRLMK